jgi:hypothetical protein
VYGAIAPTPGARCVLALPYCNTVSWQSLREALAHHDQDSLHMVLLENGSCQKAQALVSPAHVAWRFLPP